MERNIKLMMLFNFFNDFRLYSIIAVIYFTYISGSLTLGMSIFSIATIATVIAEIPTGIIGDYIGRKKTIILGSVFGLFEIVLYALGVNYLYLVLGAILGGIASSFFSGNNSALLYETCIYLDKKDSYTEILGKTSSMFQLALMISAVIGGFIANISFAYVFWISLVFQLICLFISFFFVEPPVIHNQSGNVFLHLKESISLFLSNKFLGILTICGALRRGTGEAVYNFKSQLFKIVWPLYALGFLSIIGNGLAFIGFWFGGKIINKFSAKNIILFGILYGVVINIFSVLFLSSFSPILMSTTGLFFGIISVAMGAYYQNHFSDTHRSTMGSLGSLLNSAVLAVMALIIGILGDKFGIINAFLIVQAFDIFILFLYLYLFRHE